MKTTGKTVVGNDTHYIFQDPAAVELFISFIAREKPNRVVLDGDILDFYKCSKYDKDPTRLDSLQDELNEVHKFLAKLRKTAPEAELDYLQGNHEERLKKYLWRQAQALASLKVLKLPLLLGLGELGISYHTDGIWIGDLYVTHGTIIRRHAGYSAKAEFEKNGCSGISGHTHRDGKYTVRNRSGHFAWWENYCLCKLDAEYIEGIANWTQGFSCITTIGKRPYVEQIPIIGGGYIYGGHYYSN